MKKIYFLLLVLFGLHVHGQIVNIPDANFKAKLLSANSSNQIASTEIPDQYGYVTNYNSIDTNNNGEIEESEAELITVLNIYESNIYDLTGIEYFSNLITLRCKNIQITNLDLTQLANLYFLDCGDNQLSTLNITQNSNLKYLYCYNSQLSDLNISQNLNLVLLQCSGNQLSSLNLSQNINLTSLGCSNNLLTTLDVSMLNNLNFLSCRGNQLSNLDVTQNLVLGFIECQNNELINLDVTQNLNLIDLNCKNNQLTNLDISQNINLRHLLCSNNLLTTLDASFNSVMNELICNNNQLNSLFIKNNNESWLYYYGSSLDFSNNPDLQYICADDEDITMIQQKIMDYNLVNCHVNSYCSFVPGGDYFSIEGQTIYDFNNNGCDLNDLNYSNLRFSITDGTISGDLISNMTGNYAIPVQSGSYTITPILENSDYFNISPTSLTVDFPTQMSPFVQDFCVTANGNHSDLEVVILPTTPVRPGFDAYYKIIYRNKGNKVESGAITFTYNDAVLDYVSANPVYDSQATDSFVWNYTNLEPFETREIEVVFNVNSPMETPAVNIDDVLNYTAVISTSNTDETPDDNEFTLNQTVVGSYDPNDKTCLEGEIVGPDMIGEYVHYLIRFENTGTYPAENVVVKDMIDMAKFDITTLIPLRGSHEFYTRIKDNKVEFIFENINLDFNDATNDGFVAFKIKTKPTLALGDTFSNNANIYFDYNFPITTNTYTTTFQALSTQDFDFNSKFTLYPNPVQDVLHFNSKENLEIQSVEIYNMLGQIVISVPNNTTSIDVSSLKSGNYFLKVNTEQGISNTKFIKE